MVVDEGKGRGRVDCVEEMFCVDVECWIVELVFW